MYGVTILDLVRSQGIWVFEDTARVDQSQSVRGHIGIFFSGKLGLQILNGGGKGKGEDVFGVTRRLDVESYRRLVSRNVVAHDVCC